MKLKKLILMLVLCFPAFVSAIAGASFFFGDVRYYTTDGETAIVVKNSDMGDPRSENYHYQFTEVTIPSVVTYNGKEIPVTAIGEDAFAYHKKLLKVILPPTIERIEYGAFYGSGITEMKLPVNLKELGIAAFSGCVFKEIELPSGISCIPTRLFENCKSLETVTLLGKITSIGGGAFRGCSSLKTFSIPESCVEIGSSAFDGCSALNNIVIPAGISTLPDEIFRGCTSLTSIKIPATITAMGASAFERCTALEKVTLSETGLQQIMENTFRDCEKLTTINLPEGLKTIGDMAFYGTNLTDVTIPLSLETIGVWAFRDCQNLTETLSFPNIVSIKDDAFLGCSKITTVVFGSMVKEILSSFGENIIKVDIGDIANWCGVSYGDLYNANPLFFYAKIKHIYLKGKEINELKIPEGVTRISANAFNGCTHLMTVNIPSTVTQIDRFAFNNCPDLNSVTFASDDNLETIGDYAFANNPGLMSIKLPSSLTSLGGALKNVEI